MCPDSDGFVMNRLEEGALGDPVLAGNLETLMGAGDTADPPVASERLGRSKLERAVAQQHGPRPNRLGRRR
jgi:hypothetical protein